MLKMPLELPVLGHGYSGLTAQVIFSDAGFFKIFSFPLVKGTAEDVLKKPFSIVLSETAAQRYFGLADPVGRKLRVENDSTYYTVTGVMKDVPENSHIHFDMVGALSSYDKMLGNDRWVINYLYTYFLIREDGLLSNVQDGLSRIVTEHVVPEYQKLLDLEDQQSFTENNYFHFVTLPLDDIHLESAFSGEFEPAGKFFYVYLFIVLAVFILVLSCMNFMNLVTAQSINRAREVGIRKISGSEKSNLIQQFLLESSLLAFFAMALALLLTELALPAFSDFIGLQLSLGQLLNSSGILLMVVLILIIGIVSGLYPAWYLSTYNPRSVLRNRFDDHPDKGRFRKALTIFQLFLAVGVLTITLIILFQFRFLVNKDRGYDTENLLVIRRPDALTNKLEDFKKQILRHPDILAATNATNAMGSGFPRFPYYPEGSPASQIYSTSTLLTSFGFDSVYRIKMADGRFFTPAIPEDSFACVINETAVKAMKMDNPLDKSLIQISDRHNKSTKYKIIGVVKDFNFETLENPIRPLIMVLMPGNFEGYLTLRLTPAHQDSTIRYIKGVWEQYTDAYPFIYYYLDQDRRDYYQPVRTTARIFFLLSMVTVLMACLSLFALASFTYSRKQREIVLLKTMGATNRSIIFRKAGEIVLMVISASSAAWIGAYFLAGYWLKDYAYHIGINLLYFIAAMVIMILLSLASIYYHTRLIIHIHPGPQLKYE
jgi:putative ABC transport system permease protein